MFILQITALVYIALSTATPIYLALRGQKCAWFYLLTFILFNLGIALQFLHDLGVLSPSIDADNIFRVGSLVHIFIMSFSIFRHHQHTMKEKEIAQSCARRADHLLQAERDALKEQREFMSMVSHEFRSPLAIIDAASYMLINDFGEPSERPLRYAKIERAVKRLRALLDNYLSSERLEADGQEPNFQACDLLQLIHNVVEDIEANAGSPIICEIENLPGDYLCDQAMLQILLHNLLENARRHSPPERPIKITAINMSASGIDIAVQDEGDGIAADEIPKVFDRFFRGRAALSKPGAGLGLFLVKRIAHLHGGIVTLESDLGKGSTFRLHLPPQTLKK